MISTLIAMRGIELTGDQLKSLHERLRPTLAYLHRLAEHLAAIA